jgi:2-phospho-L-lactate/phosphoenolpyruvate guanylyltransferase
MPPWEVSSEFSLDRVQEAYRRLRQTWSSIVRRADASRQIGKDNQVRGEVDLVVPVKALNRAKSRLVGVTGDPITHAALAQAFALDTVSAALCAEGVRRVLAVTSDPVIEAEMAALGVESVSEPETAGLNAAVRRGAEALRDRDRDRAVVIGALQADLPSLRPAELAAAIASADGRRAFCPDRQGTGTTLLLGAAGAEIDPRFGVGSAGAHAASGAAALIGTWPSLRCDVDTAEDLRFATTLGLGFRTAGVMSAPTSTIHTHHTPESDTLTASWTRSPDR